MNISLKVSSFLNSIDKKTREFYNKNNKVKKFINPLNTSSQIQERTMRLGIEERMLGPMTDDELYLVACATLHEDYMKSHSGKCIVPIRCILDIKDIFKEQLQQASEKLYFMIYDNNIHGKKTIVSLEYEEYDYILSKYKYAELSQFGATPTLCQ